MGRDLCTQLAAEGAHIAMCDMSDESMEETKALCLAANPSVTVTTARCDVSNEAEVLAWRDEVSCAIIAGIWVAFFQRVPAMIVRTGNGGT